MASVQLDRQSQSGMSKWLRVLRPFFWWGILVLVLYGYRVHQRLAAETRLTFSTILQGRVVDNEASATLDGRQIWSGGQVPLGWHTFSISHPKAETCTTNLFIWYGKHDLGEMALLRGTGTLSIQSSPPAALLTIRGPEFSVTLTNSAGADLTVPMDRYVVEAKYGHAGETQDVSVYPHLVGSWRFAPRIGALRVTCNQYGASFQLLKADGQLVEEGELPATVKDVPEGRYNLVGVHHGNRREQSVTVGTGKTNSVEVDFLYGAAILDSRPSGATVTSGDGRSWGATPLQLTELNPGHWDFVLRRDGYEPVSVSVEVSANQTSSVSTNLVSQSYGRAMNAARQYLAASDYSRAWEASSEALVAKPDDPDAAAIQKEATKRGTLARAKTLGSKGDYDGGVRELESAQLTLPEDEEIKQLLSDFKKRQQEMDERRRQEQTSRAKAVFDAMMANNSDASLFDGHELKTSKPADEVKIAVTSAFQNARPAFAVNELKSSESSVFILNAKQELPNGLRQCLVVGGQTFPDEVQVFWKVLEYTKGQSTTVFGGITVSSNMGLTAIHQTRYGPPQVTEGIELVRGLLQRAVE